MSEPITQRELARRLGITPRAVRYLRDRHGMPEITRQGAPRYLWPECARWYIRFKIEEAGRRGGPPTFKGAHRKSRKSGAPAAGGSQLGDSRPERAGR